MERGIWCTCDEFPVDNSSNFGGRLAGNDDVMKTYVGMYGDDGDVFDYQRNVVQMLVNEGLNPDLETCFMLFDTLLLFSRL